MAGAENTNEAIGLRESLNAALKEVEDSEEIDSGTEDGAAAPPAKEPGEGAPPVKEPEAEASAEVKKTEEEEKTDAKPEVEKPGEAPKHWAKADRELFAKQPKEAQDFLMRRHKEMEGDYTRRVQGLGALKDTYEPIDRMFEPWKEQLKKNNMTVGTLIAGWAGVEERLMKGEGVPLLADVAKAYKIDPIQLATQVLATGGVIDPAKTVEEIMRGVKAGTAAVITPADRTAEQERLDRIEADLHADRTEKYNNEIVRINKSVDDFRAAKAPNGDLLHPYFDEVMDTIVDIANLAAAKKTGAKSLDQLYEEAIWQNTTVRQKFLAAQEAANGQKLTVAQQDEQRKAAEEMRKKAQKAKRAGSSVAGSGQGGGQSPANPQRSNLSLREQLSAAVQNQEENAPL